MGMVPLGDRKNGRCYFLVQSPNRPRLGGQGFASRSNRVLYRCGHSKAFEQVPHWAKRVVQPLGIVLGQARGKSQTIALLTRHFPFGWARFHQNGKKRRIAKKRKGLGFRKKKRICGGVFWGKCPLTRIHSPNAPIKTPVCVHTMVEMSFDGSSPPE